MINTNGWYKSLYRKKCILFLLFFFHLPQTGKHKAVIWEKFCKTVKGVLKMFSSCWRKWIMKNTKELERFVLVTDSILVKKEGIRWDGRKLNVISILLTKMVMTRFQGTDDLTAGYIWGHWRTPFPVINALLGIND